MGTRMNSELEVQTSSGKESPCSWGIGQGDSCSGLSRRQEGFLVGSGGVLCVVNAQTAELGEDSHIM